MRNFNYRNFFSSVAMISLLVATTVNAAPVRFNQVVQVVNAKPGKAKTGNFSQLRLANDPPTTSENDPPDSTAPVPSATPPQDDRVITETTYDVVEEEVCDCEDIPPVKGGFPYFALLPLAAIPLFFIPGDDDDPDTTPTPPMTPTMTPTITPPPMSPTPPDPVPEPMTILLFGTGLAGIGMAARRRFGKKDEEQDGEE